MRRIDSLVNFTRIRKAVACFLTSISAASVFQSIVIFLFIYVMSHCSSELEYAEYRKIFYIIDFSTAVSLFGLNNLILRKTTQKIYEDIVPAILIINAIQLVSVLVFLFIQHLTLFQYLEIVVFISLNTLYQISVSIIVLRNLRRLYFSCTTLSLFVASISLFVLVRSNALTFQNAFLLRFVILLLYIIPFLIFVGNRIVNIKLPSFEKVVDLFNETAPIGFGVLLGSCTQYIDKFIASMMDSHQLAVYANASASVPFVGTAITTMSVFYIPIIHSCFSKKDYQGACANMSNLFLFGWYIGVTVFTLLFCNAEFIVDLLYSSRYSESIVLFRIFCFGYLFRIISYTQIIVSLELEHIIIKRMLIEMILQLVLSFTFLKLFGTLGLALSVILVLGLWSVPYNVFNFKKRLNCSLSDILPLKKMLMFFMKAFVPCLISVVIMNHFCLSKVFIFVVSCVLYLLINLRELVYIINKTR